MTMVETQFTLSDKAVKWALVTVSNTDGTFARQFRIERDAYDAFMADPKGVPPGVTEQEWLDGLAVVTGRPCDVGEGYESASGHLVVNHGVQQVGNEMRIKLTRLEPEEWRLVDGKIFMLASVLAKLE